MTAHAQEAIRAFSAAYDHAKSDDIVHLLAVEAQVHATLALVEAQNRANEQQRIANLIALGILGEHAILTEQVSEDAAISLVEHKEHAMGGYFQLAPEIAAALGIEQDS